MRVLLFIIALLFTCLAITGITASFWSIQQYKKPGPLNETALFVIERGRGVSYIADKLSYANIISDPLIFKLAARIIDQHKNLKAGEYEIEDHISMKSLMELLISGNVYQRQFTIPEGLTSWQIVQLLNQVNNMEGKVTEIPVEGSLLPETYNYLRGDDRQNKIIQMQRAMEDSIDDLWLQRAKDLPISSKQEAIILASIVEKETSVTSERKRVAGVFINRLKRKMKLQSDPTVIYAITSGVIQDKGKGPLGRRLLTKDFGLNSPYNTYKYSGLPFGPIANPGYDSIAATLNPENHSYLYFVADGTGGHVFSKNLKEHNRNVAKWHRIRRIQKNTVQLLQDTQHFSN